MATDVTFMMGEIPVVLPRELRYCRNHLWSLPAGERFRFGLSAYAVEPLAEAFLVEWEVKETEAVHAGQVLGSIETPTGVTEITSPVDGIVGRLNRALLLDPSPLVLDNYAEGWLFELSAQIGLLMTAAEYRDHLAQEWKAHTLE